MIRRREKFPFIRRRDSIRKSEF